MKRSHEPSVSIYLTFRKQNNFKTTRKKKKTPSTTPSTTTRQNKTMIAHLNFPFFSFFSFSSFLLHHLTNQKQAGKILLILKFHSPRLFFSLDSKTFLSIVRSPLMIFKTFVLPYSDAKHCCGNY